MKKWTYLVAAVLMSGTAPFFTSCIDNDEPEGITILRKAKAELISAKKAIVEAEAAEKLAQAELAKADAEVKRAEAEIKKAQAELIKAQTEGEKAKIEAEIKKIEAEAEKVLAEAEAARQAAADAHAKALKELEVLQATLQKEQQAALQLWVTRYDNAQKTADEKKMAYNAAQRAYTKALNDSEVFDATDVEKLKELEAGVRKAEKQVANLKEITKVGLETELADAKKLTPGELPTRLEEVRAELEQQMEAYAKAEMAIAEFEKNDPDAAKLIQMMDKLNTILDEELTIKSFEIEFPEMGVPGWNGSYVFNGGYDWNYTLRDNAPYELSLESLNDFIKELEGLKLDENDQAWTEQSIIDLKAEHKPLVESFDVAKESWQEAVNAYKTTDGSVNLEAFDTYAPLKEAVAAYNATLPVYNTAKENLDAADQALQDAINKKDETKTLQEILVADIQKAFSKNEDNKKTYLAEADAARDEIAKERKKLTNELLSLEIEIDKAVQELLKNPTDETLKKAVDEAKAAYAEAEKKFQEWEKSAEQESVMIQAEYFKKVQISQSQYEIDRKQAQKDYQDKLMAYGYEQKDPALQQAIDKAMADYQDKLEAFNKEEKVVDDAFAELEKAYQNFQVDIEKWNVISNPYAEILLENIAQLSREEAKQLVQSRSVTVWGSLIAYKDADSEYNIPEEYLIGLDKEDVDAIIRSYFSSIENWQLHEYYNSHNFGLFGEVLGSDYQIAVAEATLKNGEALDGVIKVVSDNLAAINATYEAQDEKYEAALKEYNTQEQVVYEKAEALMNTRDEIGYQMLLNLDIEAALLEAIKMVPEENSYTQADIDKLIAALEVKIDMVDEDIIVAEGAVEVANQKIEDFKNGKLTEVDEAKETMEVAKEESELADKRAADAKADLDKAIAKLEQAEAE